MKILTAAILPVALLAAACDIKVDESGIRGMRVAEGRAEDVWTRTYTVSANGRLEIAGTNGAIEVEAADGPQVTVRAEREVRAGSDQEAQALLRKLEIREEVSADSVRISTAGDASGDLAGMGRRAQVEVEYRVQVPAGLTLTFRTENGGVRMENVNGHITAATTNGGINGTALAGSLTASTVNGGIRLDLASLSGDLKLSTTNGGVRLDIPVGTKANLDAICVNGGIDVDDDFGLADNDGCDRVTATLNGGGPQISASSVNGGIRIRARSARETD